jgi:hypothetical protein
MSNNLFWYTSAMIPQSNRELLIKNLQKGMSMTDACKASDISKDTLYRIFEYQPDFKKKVLDTVDQAKKK